MLKGLKKSKPNQEVEVDRVRAVVNENSIKSAQIEQDMKQEGDVMADIEQQHAMKEHQMYEECLRLFLAGSTETLIEKIEALKAHSAEQKIQQNPTQQKGRFDYNMTFQGSESNQKVKNEIKKRNRPIMASNRVQNYCVYCPDNEDLALLSASNYVYLALAKYKTFEGMFHFILAPVDHEQTSIGLNEDILTELTNYKKCLIQAFDKYDLQVVFFEQFSRDNSHIYTQCLALPRSKAQDLPFFFKQALEDIEGNWNTHRSIIKIEKDKGGLQKQIPKQIKYFYVDFCNGHGYAHVIQNQKFWKRQFVYEVLATALNMEIHKVKTTQPFSQQQIAKKRQSFGKIWKAFDWTQLI